MTTKYFKTHDWAKYREATGAARKALETLDRDLRGLARRTDMFDGERAAAERASRAVATTAVAAARRRITEMIAEDRQQTRYVDEPTGEALQRRAYYAQAAQQDLAGRDGMAALAMVRNLVESGAHERAREYIRAARPLVGSLDFQSNSEFGELTKRAEPLEAKHLAGYRAGVDAFESMLPWLDRGIQDVSTSAGRISDEAKAGQEMERPVDTRPVSLWVDTAAKAAVAAVTASAPAAAATDGAGAGPAGGGAE